MTVSYDTVIAVTSHPASPSRENVLEAAEAILVEEGAAALTMRRLAKALGVSYQVIYSRVGDKAGLVRALHDEGFARLTAAAVAVEAEVGTDAHVVAMGQAYLAMARANPVLFDVMFGVPIPEFVRDDAARKVAWKGFRASWVAACRAWLEARYDERPPRSSVRLAWRLWTAVHGITTLSLAGHAAPSDDIPAEIERTIRTLLREPF